MSLKLSALQWYAVRAARRAAGRPRDLAARRAGMARLAQRRALPRGVALTETTLGGLRALRLAAPGHRGTVLHFHGGAYAVGTPDTVRAYGALAVDSGPELLSVEYRLAPEHPYPAALDDALAAYTALLERVPAHEVVLVGESAGGGLALALVQLLKARDLPLPAGVAVVAPWIDLTHSGDSARGDQGRDILTLAGMHTAAATYAGDADLTDPYLSPLFGDHVAHPATYTHVGGRDLLLDDAVRLHQRLLAAGSLSTLDVFAAGIHTYCMLPSPEARSALSGLRAFVVQQLALTRHTPAEGRR